MPGIARCHALTWEAVTAARHLATVEASVGLDCVSVVAGLGATDEAVAANRLAGAWYSHAGPTCLNLAVYPAAVAHHEVGVVAPLHEDAKEFLKLGTQKVLEIGNFFEIYCNI